MWFTFGVFVWLLNQIYHRSIGLSTILSKIFIVVLVAQPMLT
jgi:hypothetical protein